MVIANNFLWVCGTKIHCVEVWHFSVIVTCSGDHASCSWFAYFVLQNCTVMTDFEIYLLG